MQRFIYIKPPCNVLFIISIDKKNIDKIIEGNYRNYVIDKLTCGIMGSGPGCSFYEFYEWYTGIFQ